MSPRARRSGSVRKLSAAIACSIVRIAGSGSYSTVHARGAAPRGLERLGEHPGHRLAVEHHLGGKQRLVVAVRAGVAFARHIGAGQHRDDARLVERRRRVERA